MWCECKLAVLLMMLAMLQCVAVCKVLEFDCWEILCSFKTRRKVVLLPLLLLLMTTCPPTTQGVPILSNVRHHRCVAMLLRCSVDVDEISSSRISL